MEKKLLNLSNKLLSKDQMKVVKGGVEGDECVDLDCLSGGTLLGSVSTDCASIIAFGPIGVCQMHYPNANGMAGDTTKCY